MNSQGNSQGLAGAIDIALQGKHLTKISSQTLLANLNATTIPASIGEQVEKLGTAMPCLVHLVIDSTGSIGPDPYTNSPGYEQAIIDAVNSAVKDFEKMMDKTGQEVYVQVTEFSERTGETNNIRILREFTHVQDFEPITSRDYRADGNTPLFSATYDGVIATSVFGASLFSVGATGVQEITVIISDGQNNVWDKRAEDVSSLLRELNTKQHFVCAFVGVGNEDEFRKIARSMGIPDGNIITVHKSLEGITKALKLVVSSVGSHSQQVNAGQQPANTSFFSSVT